MYIAGVPHYMFTTNEGGDPGAVVKAACLESLGSPVRTPLWHSSFKETKVHSPLTRKDGILCSVSDRQSSNFEFSVWRAVSSDSSHHPQDILLAQLSTKVA